MPSFTVQELVTRAAAIADMHDNFVLPEQWIAWANVERQALDVFLLRHGWVLQSLRSSTYNLDPANPDRIVVTPRPLAVVGVYEALSNGRARPLEYTDHVSMVDGAGRQGPAHFFSLTDVDIDSPTGANDLRIDLMPAPTAPSTYYAVWIAQTSNLAALTDSVAYALGFEERMVLGMARRALIKEESDAGKIERLMREEEAKIEEACWARVMGQAPSVRNRDGRNWSREERLFPEVSRWHWV